MNCTLRTHSLSKTRTGTPSSDLTLPNSRGSGTTSRYFVVIYFLLYYYYCFTAFLCVLCSDFWRVLLPLLFSRDWITLPEAYSLLLLRLFFRGVSFAVCPTYGGQKHGVYDKKPKKKGIRKGEYGKRKLWISKNNRQPCNFMLQWIIS